MVSGIDAMCLYNQSCHKVLACQTCDVFVVSFARDSDAREVGCVPLDHESEPRNTERCHDGDCTLFIALPFPLFPAPETTCTAPGCELWRNRVKSHFWSCELFAYWVALAAQKDEFTEGHKCATITCGVKSCKVCSGESYWSLCPDLCKKCFAQVKLVCQALTIPPCVESVQVGRIECIDCAKVVL